MFKCIFCDSESNTFHRDEHVIPESLGGDIVLPEGLVCDQCNNYFGRSVELKALHSPQLSFMRALLSQQNKRGKFHRHIGLNWEVAGGSPESTFVLPESRIKSLIQSGRGQIRIPQFGNSSICRLVLKIGVECLAMSSEFDIFDNQFCASRRAARAPQRSLRWPMTVSHVDDNQLGIYYTDPNDDLFYREFIYDLNLAFDSDFGMIGIQFIYGWFRFITPLNDVGLKHFDKIVYSHNLRHPTENELRVIKPDISKLD